jgi:hypothetical protein
MNKEKFIIKETPLETNSITNHQTDIGTLESNPNMRWSYEPNLMLVNALIV